MRSGRKPAAPGGAADNGESIDEQSRFGHPAGAPRSARGCGSPASGTRDSLGEGGRLVWDYLDLYAQRRYAEANAFLAPGCEMLLPGGVVLTDCLEMPQRSASLYRWVQKVFEPHDEHTAADGIVVYNVGTLRGEWPDGTPFAGVRYIDRLLIRDGRIADQQVWNDLCIAAAARQAATR